MSVSIFCFCVTALCYLVELIIIVVLVRQNSKIISLSSTISTQAPFSMSCFVCCLPPQEIAEKIGENMEQYHGVKFQRGFVPVSIERLSAEGEEVERLKVVAASASTKEIDESVGGEYNTVLFATGRDPNTADIGLASAGVNVDEK